MEMEGKGNDIYSAEIDFCGFRNSPYHLRISKSLESH